ncbi:hypothetical protein O6H91_16G060900 [Diphasiastrum complanatum]|uniref:Uncharacterized protein n=1 Tax=Diphasiastrum complanatum TaxID=34168 RepID=A0ACC2BCQ3_DIPCM|nr:hypothetical protein O6H91_16G060900 [Diphasiastrum complanatum]
MAMDNASEGVPLEFPAFPFKPYPIQLHFMTAVYNALQKGGVAVVESPTGTGKTLSLICSVLQWLQDHHHGKINSEVDHILSNKLKSLHENEASPDEPDWMLNFNDKNEEEKRKKRTAKKQQSKPANGPKRVVNTLFGKVDETEKELLKKQTETVSVADSINSSDDELIFLLADYDSDDSCMKGATKRNQNRVSTSSSEEDFDAEKEDEAMVKVFFCSRTHSQLSQFIGELKRTVFAESMQVVSLGSRKTLCINEDVLKLGNATRINERCLEMQKSKSSHKVAVSADRRLRKSKITRCPMMRKQSSQQQFKQELLDSVPLDIEDLVRLGKKLTTCPYYGSRQVIPVADIVVLPYQSLLHLATRDSLGVKLKNCIVIFDEAHNLVDTITDTYSCRVSAVQLRQVTLQLSGYLERFKNRLTAGNRRYIQTLLVLINAFIRRIDCIHEDKKLSLQEILNPVVEEETPKLLGYASNGRYPRDAEIMTINDFLFSLQIDNINLFKLRRYIRESNIVNKVSSYGEKQSFQVSVPLESMSSTLKSNAAQGGSTSASFHALADFVLALTNQDADGRVLITPSCYAGVSNELLEGNIKFVMLNAAKHFSEVVDQARAVVLAGGTLQPIGELRERLFPDVPEEHVHIFSCGHIVPPESILPLIIPRGPTGKAFDFTFQSRSLPVMVEELGRLLVNVSLVVPEGIVVFLPSFEYENLVHNLWMSTGILDSISRKKHIFREPRDASSVEMILQEYKNAIMLSTCNQNSDKSGAVLFCIVGAKMSEGINFSDGMGRCVIMVGLPYPSPSDPELLERMRYIDNLARKEISISQENSNCSIDSGISALKRCGQRGKEYYENLCMKAVNQSIGRAIRHIQDYAAILLVDARYDPGSLDIRTLASGPTSKLAGWIRNHLIPVRGGFGEVHKQLRQFFKYNKERAINQSLRGAV